ncbi:MAG: enoyl-CoA hydratase [Desulfobacteraceae bacterium]|nr:enoyl-CoA hydratase [Desulfobacteraceae bacterium]
MSDNDLLYAKQGNAAWITINRETRRNAISAEAITLFSQALTRAQKDEDVRVVCITGAGDKVFCSGADLMTGIGTGEEEEAKVFKAYADLLIQIYRFEKPTVAKINGHCLAGGTGFMLACDIVLARDNVIFGTPEVNVGLFPMMIGALIFKNVLRKKAMEMMLLGEKLTAQQALEMGMLTQICTGDVLEQKTMEILDALAAKSPIGLKLGKQALNSIENLSFEDSVHLLSKKLEEVSKTEDAREGITAFLEKRAPKFTGK